MKVSNDISFSGYPADVDVTIRSITNILSNSNQIGSKIQYLKELEKKKDGCIKIRTIGKTEHY